MYSTFQERPARARRSTPTRSSRAERSGRASTGSRDILNLADEAFLVLEDVTVDEFGSRGDDDADRVRAGQPRRRPVRGGDDDPSSRCRSCGRRRRRSEAMHLDPAVPGHRQDPPDADEGPARGAGRADRPLLPGDGRDVLVGRPRRAAPAGVDGRGEPPARPDPRAAQGGSTRGPATLEAGSPAGGRRRPAGCRRLLARSGGPAASGPPAGPGGRPTRPSRRRTPRRPRGRAA